jgi:hypothetical protein
MDQDRWFIIPGLVVARRVKTRLYLHIPRGSCSPTYSWGKYEVKRGDILSHLREIYHSVATGEPVTYVASGYQESAASFLTIGKEIACSPQVSGSHKIGHSVKVHVNEQL